MQKMMLFLWGLFRYVSPRDWMRVIFGRLFRKKITIRLWDGSVIPGSTVSVAWALYQHPFTPSSQPGFYEWEFRGQKIVATVGQFLGLVNEWQEGTYERIYQTDFLKKTVLDVGAFIGDSALHFFHYNAAKVICVEPLPNNFSALTANLVSFGPRAEFLRCAVGDQDGEMEISSAEPPGSPGFGKEEGDFHVVVPTLSFSTLLERYPCDVCKVDCEGGEVHLLSLSTDFLQKVPFWMVETHSLSLSEKICRHFLRAGFENVFSEEMAPGISLYHFSIK